MSRDIEVRLPEQASDEAHMALPKEAVPEVAEALRDEEGEEPSDEADEEYVTRKISEWARDATMRYRTRKARREALAAVKAEPLEW